MSGESVKPLIGVGSAAEGWCDVTAGVCFTPSIDERINPQPTDPQQPTTPSEPIPAAAEQE